MRAPVEFEPGSLPGAINLPILNNEERALIGTVYKKQGSAAAVKLGYELVSGSVKEARVQKWISFVQKNPSVVLYCFRGGQRSQITQKWLKEAGINRPLIPGGYKFARNFLLDTISSFSREQELVLVSGPTGGGKTMLLKELEGVRPSLALEHLANHRGSAFGAMEEPQPAQANFENQLATSMIFLRTMLNQKKILVEDESRLIGRCILPNIFFDKLRASSVVWIEETLEKRIDNIFQDYILHSLIVKGEQEAGLRVFARYKNALQKISKKLGGLKTKQILDLILLAEQDFISHNGLQLNKAWIEELLVFYYDPLYLSSLQRRQVNIQFKGSYTACLEYLKAQQ